MGIKIDTENPGTFIVSFAKRHPETNQSVNLRRIGVKTKAEANRVFNELVIKVDEKIKRQITPTWSDAINKYIEDCRNRGLTESTIYSAEKCLVAHTVPAWGERLVDSITTPEVKDQLQLRLSQNATTHQKYVLNCIRSVFRFALESNYIQRNPAPMIKFKVADKIHGVLNEEQTKTLLQKAQEHEWDWYPHYAMALYTGMRNGELYALTWDKLNLEQRTIKVDRSWNNKAGFKNTKSGDDRMVEIAPPLLALLRELKLQYGGVSEFVLPRNAKWDKGEQARELRMFLKSIGLPEIRFHDLRATWATMLLGKNVSPAVVMKMGGWKDMETMMIYMRKAGLDIRGATDVLENLHFHGVKEAKIIQLKG